MIKKENIQNVMSQYEINYQEIAKQILTDRTSKNSYRVAAILHDNYNQRFGKIETQNEFIESLKKSTYNKLQIQLMDAERLKQQDNKKQEKQIKDKVIKKGIGSNDVEKTVEDQLNKNDQNDNNIKDKKEVAKQHDEIKSETLKAVYEDALDKYYNLKLKVDSDLQKNGELNPDDKTYCEYIEYENYLRKIDVAYKNVNGKYIALDDKDIKKKEMTYLRKDMQAEYKTQEDVGNTIESIVLIQDQIEEINDKIISLADDYKHGRIEEEKYDKQVAELQTKLCEKNEKLENVKPLPEEIKKYEEKSKEYEDAKDKILGTSYNEFRQKNGLYKEDRQTQGMNEKNENTKQTDNEIMEEKTQETIDSQKESIEVQKEVLQNQVKQKQGDLSNLNKVEPPDKVIDTYVEILKERQNDAKQAKKLNELSEDLQDQEKELGK